MSSLNYDATKALFAVGHYVDVVRRSDTSDAALSSLTPPHRLLIARALLHIDAQRAREIARNENCPSASPSIRASCELITGVTRRRDGAYDEAIAHLQRAVQLARESGDSQQMAWTYLYLFRLLVEIQPGEAAAGLLAKVRTAVARAGDPHASAFMHDSIALIEGSSGRLDEAMRHLRISDSLLEKYPNAWLGLQGAISKFCIAFLDCDFESAQQHIQKGKRLLTTTGSRFLRTILECNEGHGLLVTGQFAAAEEQFHRAVAAASQVYGQLGVFDGLARLYLATGRYSECEDTLNRIEAAVSADQRLSSGFPRYAIVTRLKLRLQCRQWTQAFGEASVQLDRAMPLKNQFLISELACIRARAAARLQQWDDVGRSVMTAVDAGATTLKERQAEFHCSVAEVAAEVGSPLSAMMRTRAHAIWRYQGNHLGPRENDCHGDTEEQCDVAQGIGELPEESHPAIVTNAVASAFDLAYSPALLGAELANVIAVLGCSPTVVVAEANHVSTQAIAVGDQCTLLLGTLAGKQRTLVCRIPDDPIKAILLGDVLRIARAALALERARQEERGRAALWPASPAEEQAGALFLAEEMQALLATARRIAPTNVPVLITGETGTGKEVLARTIHAYSTRAAATFLPFNCSGVPKEMLDSQLFGHRRGSFTGAIDHFPGVIRAAAGGTLFLDEIGETTLDVQPKLLRFLEAGEVHPIGETQPVRADVRVIAATNADLDALVAQGRFREDLFYRLNIVRLHVPPLRERRVEIPALAHHYLQKHAEEYRKGDLRLAEETMEYLVLYRWPGNVRQLANETRRMAALAETGAVLMPEHLSPEIAASRRTVPASERTLAATELVVRLDQPMAAAGQHLERAMILYALAKCGGRMEETAALLGLSRKGLYLKRMRLGIEEPSEAAAPAVDVA